MESPILHLLVHLLDLLHVGETARLVLQQGLELITSLVDLLKLLLQVVGELLLRPEVVHVHPEVVHQSGPEVVQLDGEVILAVVELVVAADQEVEDDLVLADPVGGKAVLVFAWEADCVDVGQEFLTVETTTILVLGSELMT